MKLDSFLPTKGSELFEFKGGPLDKLGWWLDADNSPEVLVADGHRYERVIRTFREVVGDRCDAFTNYPDELFDFGYHYRGKP